MTFVILVFSCPTLYSHFSSLQGNTILWYITIYSMGLRRSNYHQFYIDFGVVDLFLCNASSFVMNLLRAIWKKHSCKSSKCFKNNKCKRYLMIMNGFCLISIDHMEIYLVFEKHICRQPLLFPNTHTHSRRQ